MPNVRVEDNEVFYKISGVGPPLVFIHGLGSSTRHWQNQVEFFRDKFQVVVFDLRGHGKSGKPPGPYTMKTFSRDTAELLKKLQLGPAHIVGLSLGGMVAFELASSHSEQVASLAIVNSGPNLPPSTLKTRLQIKLRFAILHLFGMRMMGKVLSRNLFPKPEHQNIRRQFVESWSENDLRAYTDSLRAILKWQGIDAVEIVRCPTLVMASDQDYTTVSYKRSYAEKMENAEVAVIEDARHALPIEQPEVFNLKLESFLAKIA